MENLPFHFGVLTTGLGVGAGCGVGIGVGAPINMGGIPALGSMASGLATGVDTVLAQFGASTSGIRAALRARVPVKGVDAGLGCGVGFGYGFGVGLFLNPGVIERGVAKGKEALEGALAKLPAGARGMVPGRPGAGPGAGGPAAASPALPSGETVPLASSSTGPRPLDAVAPAEGLESVAGAAAQKQEQGLFAPTDPRLSSRDELALLRAIVRQQEDQRQLQQEAAVLRDALCELWEWDQRRGLLDGSGSGSAEGSGKKRGGERARAGQERLRGEPATRSPLGLDGGAPGFEPRKIQELCRGRLGVSDAGGGGAT